MHSEGGKRSTGRKMRWIGTVHREEGTIEREGLETENRERVLDERDLGRE